MTHHPQAQVERKGMRQSILEALANGAQLTAADIITEVHRISGVEWKRSSIQKALGSMVTKGTVNNLGRDRVTGYYRSIPCHYELAS